MISRTPHHACDLTGYRVLVGAAICFLMLGIVALTGSDDRTSKTHRALTWSNTWSYLKEKALGRPKPEFKLMKNARVSKLVKTANDHMCLKTEHNEFLKFRDANKLVKQALQKQIDCLTKKLQAAEKTLGTANKNLITRNDKYTDAKAQLRKEKADHEKTQKKLQAAEKMLKTANTSLITRRGRCTDARTQLRKEKSKTAQLTQQLKSEKAGHEKTKYDLRLLPEQHRECVLYQLLKTKVIKSVLATNGGESLTRMKERVAASHLDGRKCICSRVEQLCEIAKQDILLRAHAITGKKKLEKYFWS